MAKINFGGEVEDVVLREEFPVEKAREVLKNEVIAIIGYGVQGPAQALNMKDQGFTVIIGQAPEFKEDWDKAIRDGFSLWKKLPKRAPLSSTWCLMRHNGYCGPKSNHV
jgi:ketol-acid reductoisomerase